MGEGPPHRYQGDHFHDLRNDATAVHLASAGQRWCLLIMQEVLAVGRETISIVCHSIVPPIQAEVVLVQAGDPWKGSMCSSFFRVDHHDAVDPG